MQDKDPRHLPVLSGLPRPARATADMAISADGSGYLHELCRRNAPTVLIDDAILTLGVDVDRLNNQGLPPLAIAIQQGNGILVRRLIERGARLQVDRFNALLYAVDCNKPEMIYGLLRLGGGIALNHGGLLVNGRVSPDTPLIVATEARRVDVMRPLLEAGAFINTPRTADRQTPLHIAAASDDVALVQLLLNHGADVSPKAESHFTPLHIAAAKGRLANLQALINAGADINAATEQGQTPLMLAIEHDQGECLQWLIAQGAALDQRAWPQQGRTALMLAARKGNLPLAQKLLEAGADPLLEDTQQQTAAQQVTRSLHPALYLLIHGEEESRLQAQFEKAHRKLLPPTTPPLLPDDPPGPRVKHIPFRRPWPPGGGH